MCSAKAKPRAYALTGHKVVPLTFSPAPHLCKAEYRVCSLAVWAACYGGIHVWSPKIRVHRAIYITASAASASSQRNSHLLSETTLWEIGNYSVVDVAHGAKHPFTVFTHDKNLEYLHPAKRLNPRQDWWALFFTRFQFTMAYRLFFLEISKLAVWAVAPTVQAQLT